MTPHSRAVGAMTGLALGDALGMPTQSMPREVIARRFGRITGLVDAPADQPIAAGMPAGSVTDDTEQALLVADLLVEGGGRVPATAFADALIAWERTMRDKGSLDLLGPSTSAAVAAIAGGTDPAEAGGGGTTNGAAMRITPVAIAVPSARPEELLGAVHDLSFVTHNTGLGLSAAAAVGGAVSAGVDGADVDEALEYGLDLARRAEPLGRWVAGASIVDRTRFALRAATRMDLTELADFLSRVVGTSVQSQESVPSALVIAHRFRDEPFDGLCFAAGLGGDTDTVAAMAGAVLGSVAGPDAFPADAVAQVRAVSGLEVEPVVARLLDLRRAHDRAGATVR
ncbi:ADP-ribosylglycohydrolase family protein [Cellulosimicrobium sp. CUA-896]|uniref:ADP-ribosylglycohydrolase family protein n=1 Tax=Cellulosimicrobium sp. CUA-896 TaxID=1517881 RepID=UPI00095D353B|nr:ADP-ribosylglycohydrolase family protein [Cellulosimicrobium sp. CUA-896]OLT46170.1 ADP-ribosylglycohydrolase [Cellulosimicrobium sp. CUA-896]